MDLLLLTEFRRCVDRYHGDYQVQSFFCLDQFLCLAFAQLTWRERLRDIETCLRAHQPQLYHLGFRGKVARTTLAEAWVLAGHVEQTGRTWQEIRADVSVKENVFEPFLARRENLRGRVFGGRDVLMKETLGNYDGLLQHCPELLDLQRRVCEAVATTPDEIP